MGFFGRTRKATDNDKEQKQFMLTRDAVKVSLFAYLTAQYDERISAQRESMTLIAQVLNYLLGDDVIVKNMKDEAPYMAVAFMRDDRVHRLVSCVLQLQQHIGEKSNANFSNTKTGVRTSYLLKTYNPENMKLDTSGLNTFLNTINKDVENMSEEEITKAGHDLYEIARGHLLENN